MNPIINKIATYVAVALVCIISGCGKKDASPPTAATPVAEKPQSSVAPPATQPAIAEPVAQKPVQLAEPIDLNSLIQRIPTNEFAMSPEGGWDKFTMPKVQKWIQSNLCGKRERINLYMDTCKIAQEDAAMKPDEWTVSLTVVGIHKNSLGMENRILPIDKTDYRIQNEVLTKENLLMPPTIGVRDYASFSIKCTEVEARKFDALAKTIASTVTVEGDIVGINLLPRHAVQHNNFVGYDIFVQLGNVAVKPSNDAEPGALHCCEFWLDGGNLNLMADMNSLVIKRLDSNGDFQLVFMKYDADRPCDPNLVSFSMTENSVFHKTSCSNPPTEAEISEAKAAVNWPNSQKLP